jgi:SAM-dependent MidA family methyltransferase
VPTLEQILRVEIAKTGPVTFRWFMEQALYHPHHGYYASGRARIGRGGDFFTSVSVGRLFGELLSAQFVEMWERTGRAERFTIVEQGAHSGDFAADALNALRREAPEFFQSLRYEIIEPFAALQKSQREKLSQLSNVSWRASLDELEPFCGVHFSNELLDAMPVHLVSFVNGAWVEKYIDEQLAFVTGPLSCEALRNFTRHLPRIEGYTTEINLDAPRWIRQLAAKITRGYVLVIDYGYPRDLYYSAARATGTLSCHRKHQRSFNPLEQIGNADITAHVDFTTLAETAEQAGLACAGFTDHHHFMVALGRDRLSAQDRNPSAELQQQLRAFKTLMHPGLMGMAFKILALETNVPRELPLRGFQFASNGKVALGLAQPTI